MVVKKVGMKVHLAVVGMAENLADRKVYQKEFSME